MKLKAVIFDVDGTLVDNEKDGHRVAFNKAFKENGLTWNWNDLLYGDLLKITGGKERIKHYINKYSPKFDINNFENEDEFIAHLHKEKTKNYVKLIEDNEMELRVGVERLIKEIKEKNIILAIATTTTYDNVTALLINTLGKESLEWFTYIGAGDIVANKKPAHDIYTLVLEKLNLKANECIAIEDSYNGVISSTSIGMPTLVTVNDYTKYHDFSKADMVIDSLGDSHTKAKVLRGNNLDNGFIGVDDLDKLL